MFFNGDNALQNDTRPYKAYFSSTLSHKNALGYEVLCFFDSIVNSFAKNRGAGDLRRSCDIIAMHSRICDTDLYYYIALLYVGVGTDMWYRDRL